MFSLLQIQNAHSKVKSGSDFPNYVNDLFQLGVLQYETFLSDGHSEFYGENHFQINSEPKYPKLTIATHSEIDKFKNYLFIHQQGQTDYMTFCKHSAECGVVKWTVDMLKRTCTYFDAQDDIVLLESIPELKK